MHSYGGEAVFFESLSQGKLMATRCDNPKCETKGSIYQPFRTICPDCLRKMTPIDMTDIAKKTAKVHTFMVCERSGAFNLLDKPIKFINIEFDGVCTILMSYLAVGEPTMGMRWSRSSRRRIRPITILDLCLGSRRHKGGPAAPGVLVLAPQTFAGLSGRNAAPSRPPPHAGEAAAGRRGRVRAASCG